MESTLKTAEVIREGRGIRSAGGIGDTLTVTRRHEGGVLAGRLRFEHSGKLHRLNGSEKPAPTVHLAGHNRGSGLFHETFYLCFNVTRVEYRVMPTARRYSAR